MNALKNSCLLIIADALLLCVIIVFSTAYDHYALSALGAGTVDYLLKPYDHSRFRQAVERVLARPPVANAGLQQLLEQLAGNASALAQPTAYPTRLFVPQGARLLAVPVRIIRYVEAAGDYATLHTASGQFFSNLGISQLAQHLDPQYFLRIHSSTLVALDAVLELECDGYFATLEGGHTVRVSRSHADAFRPLLG